MVDPVRETMAEIGRDEILSLVPHQGGMCLLDRVLDWDDDRIRLATGSHRRADNPLRRDGRLHALHLAEYGAQAMAVHGGLLARRDGARAKPGLLVALRGVELHCERIDDLAGELCIGAERLLRSEDSAQYRFEVYHEVYRADRLLAQGRAAVMFIQEATE